VEAHIHRFYKEMGETTRRLAFENGIGRLILAGPGERVAEFRRTLPNEVRDRVVAEAHIPTGASESEIVDRITAVQERVELERDNRFIAEARERGVRGRSDTLEALQLGEVYHLLVPWPSEGEVRWCDNDALAVQDVQREHCPYCGDFSANLKGMIDRQQEGVLCRIAS
jgi:peptide subunit release factor 1 (eRF1)